MTSKLDTAGLVEHFGIDAVDLDMIKRGDMLGPKLGAKVFAAIEALTQSDMEPVAWMGPFQITDNPIKAKAWQERFGVPIIPLVTTSQLAAMRERAERAERERDAAHQAASKLTKALVGLTPGGSEYFTWCEALDDYFADVDQCVRVIRERFDSGHQAKIERVDERRRAEAAEARVAELETIVARVPDALSAAFSAGIEERDGGSARRQEKYLAPVEELRRDIAALAHKGEGRS